MTVSIHITYTPLKERFDDVLDCLRRYIAADMKNPDRFETRLFSNRDDCLIKTLSTWTNVEAFYTFMDAAIDDGAFADQGHVLQHEMQVQIFKPESIEIVLAQP